LCQADHGRLVDVADFPVMRMKLDEGGGGIEDIDEPAWSGACDVATEGFAGAEHEARGYHVDLRGHV
jgi:hypothetical protein